MITFHGDSSHGLDDYVTLIMHITNIPLFSSSTTDSLERLQFDLNLKQQLKAHIPTHKNIPQASSAVNFLVLINSQHIKMN